MSELKTNLDGDTIAARATPAGKGALAVIRLSGPDVSQILQTCLRTGPGPRASFPKRKLVLATVNDAQGRDLDRVLMAFMPGPHSYTGEDVAELYCHGGEAVVSTVLQRLMEAGARPAMRGEFTRRAFERGKMDLSQAEAVVRLIDAGSRADVLGANRALAGELGKRSISLREEIEQLLAWVEAGLDYSEESDVTEAGVDQLEPLLKAALELEHCVRRKPDADQPEVVVAGRPNVGKSSLVNALAQRPVSIVTEEAGTTRDAVATDVLLDSWRVRLVDTAGRSPDGKPSEEETVSLAARAAAQVAAERVAGASLIIWVGDRLEDMRAGYPLTGIEAGFFNGTPVVRVMNKSDLLSDAARFSTATDLKKHQALLVSARTGQGLNGLARQVADRLDQLLGPADGIPVSDRQAEAVRQIRDAIENARNNLDNAQTELVAEDLKAALHGLGLLRGETVSTDVLDRIFDTFCVGK